MFELKIALSAWKGGKNFRKKFITISHYMKKENNDKNFE